MTRTCYDAINPANVPASATLVAGYGDGYWNDVAAFRRRFPHATVVEITVFASDDQGTVLDVETGDATPAQAPGWVKKRRAAGVDPTIYCNASTWPEVKAAFAAAKVAPPHYWIAHYDGVRVIPQGAVAKQYQDPGPYDLSVVADYWPGVDPAPKPPTPPEPPVTPAEIEAIADRVVAKLTAPGARDAIGALPLLWWVELILDHTKALPVSTDPHAQEIVKLISQYRALLAPVLGSL